MFHTKDKVLKLRIYNIVICGGGYAGIQTALELDRLLLSLRNGIDKNEVNAKITIIDKNENHIMLPNLPEIILNRGFYSMPYRDIFARKRKIKFIQAIIETIDLQKKMVMTISPQAKGVNNSKSINYDMLVLALGSRPFLPPISGLAEFAQQFSSIEDVKRLVKRLAELPKIATRSSIPLTIVIAGAGATGIEITGEIATYFERVFSKNQNNNKIRIILVSSSLLEGFPERARAWAKNYLQAIGIELKIGPRYRISRVEERTIILQSGERIRADLFIWTGGVTASLLPKKTGLRTGYRDRVITNSYLQSIDRPDVFAVGDCALIIDKQGNVLSTSAQLAEQQGKIAARNIHAMIFGKDLKKYTPTIEGFAVSIGPTFAVARLGTLDQYGINASNIKKLIKMKYLKEISGLSAAISDYKSSRF